MVSFYNNIHFNWEIIVRQKVAGRHTLYFCIHSDWEVIGS